LLASYLTYRYFEAPAQTLIRSHLLSKKGRPLAQAQPRL
jgi:peptidoglycan/LPS O-acetylase OafA/YrhL